MESSNGKLIGKQNTFFLTLKLFSLFFFLFSVLSFISNKLHAEPDNPWIENIITLTREGGRIDWSHALNLIAFDKLYADDSYYDINTMRPDGSDMRSITANHPDLPG